MNACNWTDLLGEGDGGGMGMGRCQVGEGVVGGGMRLKTLLISVFAVPVWQVAGAADYAVVVSEGTAGEAGWGKVVAALAEKHGATVMTWKGSVDEVMPALKGEHPRFTCFVATPAEAGRDFVNGVHRMTRKLDKDPWEVVTERYPIGAKVKGKVTNITDYGAFVELEDGIEGLIHVSEMSWTKKNVHPGKILSTSEAVEVQVLDIDSAKRRISLGLKQTQKNPWEAFSDKYPTGTDVEGEIKNITEFGLFIGLDGDVDGMVHLSDIDWKRSGEEAIKDFKKGDRVKARVLDVDREKERISLGIKQLGSDPLASASGIKKGDTVTCEVLKVEENGLEVMVAGTDMTAYVKRADLARDRAEQRPERFAVGEKFDAKVTIFDQKARKMNVSIKALEIADEKEAVAQYGSSDSGASLGDILGAALKKQKTDE
jgi:predicted RNA-binding protein with RPS1 domain